MKKNEPERIPPQCAPRWLHVSADSAPEAHKGPRSLSLEAGELTFMVVTEFLTFNRGGKIMMFPFQNGAIK